MNNKLAPIFIIKCDSLLRGASNRKTDAEIGLCGALRSHIVPPILILSTRRVLTGGTYHLDKHVYMYVIYHHSREQQTGQHFYNES